MTDNKGVDFTVSAGEPLRGGLRVPGDKSISHRALMLGAIAEGRTQIEGFLDSEDTNATMNALRLMGVEIERTDNNVISIEGVGLHGLTAPAEPLNLGNSGTSVRLFAGLLAGQAFDSQLLGDVSLMQRPMQRITDPLQQMGANICCTEAGTLPIRITGNASLKGMTYTMPVASAQLKSAILLAGLYASGKTCVREPAVTRDHSERMLAQFACVIEKDDKQICISPQPLRAQDISVPADISSAAFFMIAASIVPGSDLLLENVGTNPTRRAVIEILQLMGADITLEDEKDLSGEPVANIRVRHSQLNGIEIPTPLVPIAIDEFPVLMVAAAYADGETRLSQAAELRVKESDRIKAMCEGLKTIGIDVEEHQDGMCVRGGIVNGGRVDSYTDHRIAMAFSVAALAASAAITIKDCANVDTSFPGFVDSFRSLRLPIAITGRAHG
jgi:3-phosphoshikimate 1-carboxyvinyltransferase